jgi:hypothetical protein
MSHNGRIPRYWVARDFGDFGSYFSCTKIRHADKLFGRAVKKSHAEMPSEKSEAWSGTIASLLLIALLFQGCALAELGAVADVGAVEAATGAAELGSAVELMEEGEAVSLGRAAAARAIVSNTMSTPLVEEVGVMRAGAQVLTYPEEYGLAEWRAVRVEGESGATAAEIKRVSRTTTIVRGRYNNLLGESIRRGNQIDHYVGLDRGTPRGYSLISQSEGLIRHWVYDLDGVARYAGAEPIIPVQYSAFDRVTLPSAAISLAILQLRAKDRGGRDRWWEQAPVTTYRPDTFYQSVTIYHPNGPPTVEMRPMRSPVPVERRPYPSTGPVISYNPNIVYHGPSMLRQRMGPYMPPSPQLLAPGRRAVHAFRRPPPFHPRCGTQHYFDQVCPATGLPFTH